MGTILNRYFLKQLTVSTVYITLLLTLIVWLTQSLRLIEILINRGVSLTVFMRLVLLLLPDLISLILPISLLVAVLFNYTKFTSDNELIVARSAGLSDLRLIRPVLQLGAMVILLLYAINLYFLPLAFQRFKDLEFDVRNTINVNMIHVGEFNTFKDIMVYVRKRQKDGTMSGVLIHDERNPQKAFSVTAEFGKIVDTPEGARLILINGSRQEFDATVSRPSILSFDQYSIDLNTPITPLKMRSRKPYERFIHELFNPDDSQLDLSMRRKLNVEAHQRLVMPITSLVFVLIALAVFFHGDYNRRGRSQKIIIAVVLCVIFEGVIFSLLNLSEKLTFITPFIYGLTLMGLVAPLWRFMKSSQQQPLIHSQESLT